MAQEKKIFTWLKKVIDSCTHDFHFDSCDNLLNLFEQQCCTPSLATELWEMRHKKWNKIHVILK